MTKSVVTYLWEGREFIPAYVNALARMVKHHLPEPHRFICVSEVTEGFSPEVEVLPMPPAARALGRVRSPEGSKFPSSYRRLWTFSKEATVLGEVVLQLDIDCIIVSDLRPLFEYTEDFVGWKVRPPPGGPMRFGGGTWLHRTGTRTYVYDRFVADPEGSIDKARAAGYRGSDQAWISYCLTNTECYWPEPSGIFCSQDYKGSSSPGRYVIRNQTRQRSGRSYTVRRKIFEPWPVVSVPAGGIILHYNGSADSKPWTSSDPVVMQFWRPFSDEEQERLAQA